MSQNPLDVTLPITIATATTTATAGAPSTATMDGYQTAPQIDTQVSYAVTTSIILLLLSVTNFCFVSYFPIYIKTLIQHLSQATGMNLLYSEQMLSRCNGDYDSALSTFMSLRVWDERWK